MMAAPAGFSDLINRKYDIAQTEATNRGALEQASAANITASTPFENVLRAAQARQANETASTIGPLAQASQAATYAGIGETHARAGLYGAQTQDINADLGEIGVLGSRYYRDQLRRMGTTYAPGASAGGTTQNEKSVLDKPPPATPAPGPTGPNVQSGYYDENGNYILGLFARGTANVKAPARRAGPPPGLAAMLQAAMGANVVPGHGSGKVDTVHAMLAPGEAVVNKAAVKHIPGGRATIAKANAKGVKEMSLGTGSKGKAKAPPPPQARQHYAAGTDLVTVPAPGQTVTNGSWMGPTAAPVAPIAPPVFFPVPLQSTPTAPRFGKRQA